MFAGVFSAFSLKGRKRSMSCVSNDEKSCTPHKQDLIQRAGEKRRLSAQGSPDSIVITSDLPPPAFPVQKVCFDFLPPAAQEQELVEGIARSLQVKVCSSTGQEVDNSEFSGRIVPSISLDAYITRLVSYTNEFSGDYCGPSSNGIKCAQIALTYLESILLTELSVHRLYLCAFLAALKMYGWDEGHEVSNHYFAEVGGCLVDDLNRMERVFCFDVLQWKFYLSSEPSQIKN